jgi:hypothetical protein
VVVSTDSGDILLIDAFEFKGLVHHPKSPEEQGAIHTLAAFAKGFLCGGAGGLLRIFERFEVRSTTTDACSLGTSHA